MNIYDGLTGPMPHGYAGVMAPDKEALRAELEQLIEWHEEYQRNNPPLFPEIGHLPFTELLVVMMPCGQWRAHTIDDLPLFSVPCECGKGYFVKYSRDDDADAWDFAPTPTHGRELVLA